MLTTPADFVTKSIWGLLMLLLLLVVYYLVNIGNRFVADEKKIEVSNKNLLVTLSVLVIIYIVFKIFNRHSFLSSLLFTIFISMILAYAINPIINYLEAKDINRGRGVLIVYVGLLALIIILGVSVSPNFVREIKKLANNFPQYAEEFSNMMGNTSDKITATVGELPPILQGIEESILDFLKTFQDSLGKLIKSFATSILAMASKVVNIVLTPIITYYFLVDKDSIKEKTIELIPEKSRKDTVQLARNIDQSLIMFIRGRMIMSLYIAVVMTSMLLIMRIEFAVVIGIITGLFDIVPYLGPFVGYVPAVFFAAINSWTKALWVTILFLIIQWVENNILAPKVIGENMDLHPLTILLSIIVGGGVFGVFGMILSVPIIATIKVIVEFYMEKKEVI